MTMMDTAHGPMWILWIVFAVFAAISIVLLSGHGASLIAGYNAASKEEKSRYDEKKLCRVTGGGLSVITLLILITAVGASVLPASFANICLAVILIDFALMIILANTIWFGCQNTRFTDFSALRAPEILQTFEIRSFLTKNGFFLMFGRVPRSAKNVRARFV